MIQKSGGAMFEFDDLTNLSVNRVWTMLASGDSGSDNGYTSPRFHVVNRMAYVMAKNPCTGKFRDAIYFPDNLDHKGEDSENG